MPWWGWIIIGAIFLSSEVMIGADFYLVFFGVSALIVGFIGLAGPALPVWAQWLAFAGLAIVSLVVFRHRLKQMLARSKELPNNDVVGENVVVTSAGTGGVFVEMRGSSWKIRSADGAALAPGDRCVVERVEGITLIVKRSD